MTNVIYTLEGTHRETGERAILHTFESEFFSLLWNSDPSRNMSGVFVFHRIWKDVTRKCYELEANEKLEDKVEVSNGGGVKSFASGDERQFDFNEDDFEVIEEW